VNLLGRIRRLFLFVLVVSSLAMTRAHPAAADEITPALETLELRVKAQAEARMLVAGLAPNDRRRLIGLYVAFDTSASDPSAMAACDDDGDYVIVISDAMLRLLSFVAQAQSADEEEGSEVATGYAEFLGRSQLPGHRLLPPPAGSFTAQNRGTTHETRLREALSFVIARELVHLRAGDLVCARPTATHENGDDVWTKEEQREALTLALRVYPGNAAPRDAEATARVLDVGRSEQGALGLLHFFAQLELERTAHASRFAPSYLAQHPSSATRISSVMNAAKEHP
jgi:hypothetical protein